MRARDVLNATYAYLCGLLGEEKVEELLGPSAAPEARRESPEAVADENRAALSALSRLRALPRVGGGG